MSTPEQFMLMARYNRWMDERLYQTCSVLTDAQRREDRGLFFDSIHGTLNHLYFGDQVWLSRFISETENLPRLGEEVFADFSELHSQAGPGRPHTGLDPNAGSGLATV